MQDDYEYATNEPVVYEAIYDANISTTPVQSSANGDETMESTQSYGMEAFDCIQCDEFHTDQRSLDAHLRVVSISSFTSFTETTIQDWTLNV